MNLKKAKCKMPKELSNKCHAIIHPFSAAAAAAGAIPIPIADAIPISAAQVAMIMSLGKIFGLTIGSSVAEEIALIGLSITGGRFIAANLLKLVPGFGSAVGAATAAAITETIGWMAADDFYRISAGEEPEKIGKAMKDVYVIFKQI